MVGTGRKTGRIRQRVQQLREEVWIAFQDVSASVKLHQGLQGPAFGLERVRSGQQGPRQQLSPEENRTLAKHKTLRPETTTRPQEKASMYLLHPIQLHNELEQTLEVSFVNASGLAL